MRLERDLFSRWCNLVFRGALGNGPIKNFEDGLDKVEAIKLVMNKCDQSCLSQFCSAFIVSYYISFFNFDVLSLKQRLMRS